MKARKSISTSAIVAVALLLAAGLYVTGIGQGLVETADNSLSSLSGDGDKSRAALDGRFGHVRIDGNQVFVHVADPNFHSVKLSAPNGWSSTQVLFDDGEYVFTRQHPFGSGKYRVEARDYTGEHDLVVVDAHEVELIPE